MAQINTGGGESSWGALIETVRQIEDVTSVSLTQYAKRSIINSRVFIQRECAESEILGDTLRVAMNMYVGFIMTAVNMNQYVNHSQTVRDIMQTVATEGHRHIDCDLIDDIHGAIASYYDKGAVVVPKMFIDIDGGISETPSSVEGTSGTKLVDTVPREVDIPSGRVIEIKFGDPKNKTSQANTTVNLFLQLTPTFIPESVADAFIGCNFTPTIKQRFLQMNTGEISFWKDFVMSHDLLKRRRKALRTDKSGSLAEMFERQQNAVSNAWLKYILFYKEKQNIANTILIFDKQTFDAACSRNGLNFKRFDSRQKFFNKTFAMMLIVIDQSYNKVETYFHGLEARGEYTFSQLKGAAKNDKYDLTDIMKAYGQGMSPKF